MAWKDNMKTTNIAYVEKRLFYGLLYKLCMTIPEPIYTFGRPTASVRDIIFSIGLKIYNNYSGRKAFIDLVYAQKLGYIKKAPHFNTITDFLNKPTVYSLLQKLLIVSAKPLNQYSIEYIESNSVKERLSNCLTLKCKNQVSQRNELMMKFICSNICCLIQEIYGGQNDNSK